MARRSTSPYSSSRLDRYEGVPMLLRRAGTIRVGLHLLAFFAAAGAIAQTPAPTAAAPAPTTAAPPPAPVVYPSKGQSDAQQQKDRTECSSWATQQTGYDPAKIAQQQAEQARQAQQAQTAAPAAPGGQVARSSAGGAAGGAALGAIAGNAGRGAAIGAAAGAAGGEAQRQQQAAAQQQAQQAASQQQAAQNAATNQKLGEYQRSFGACMTGRGYTVK
jgi:hypothetical protein